MKKSEKCGLLEEALTILRNAASGTPFRNQAELARATGESEANISRWLSGVSTPTLRRLEPVLMTLGVRFTLPSESAQHITRTEDRDAKAFYRVDSWKILRDKARLPQIIMLKMPPQDISMQPTINPNDIVVIDTSSTDIKERSIYLLEHGYGEKNVYSFRRVLMAEYHTPKTVVFCADNISSGCKPVMLDPDCRTVNIMGVVRNIIKQA